MPDIFLLKIHQIPEKHYWVGKTSVTCLRPFNFFNENKTCIFKLVFLLMLVGEQIVILMIKETYLVKRIQSNGVNNLYIDCLISSKPCLKNQSMFFMFCGHFLLFRTLFWLICSRKWKLFVNWLSVSQNYFQPLLILECCTSILLKQIIKIQV